METLTIADIERLAANLENLKKYCPDFETLFAPFEEAPYYALRLRWIPRTEKERAADVKRGQELAEKYGWLLPA